MRVLVIDEEVPCPLNSGKRIRTFNLLSNLADRHDIVFLCRYHEGSDGDRSLLEGAGIVLETVPDPIRRKGGIGFYWALFINLFSLYPYSVASHYSARMVAKTVQLHAKHDFDLIHCEWTPYAVNMNTLFSLPSVVDAHNVEAMIWHRNVLVERNIFKKGYFYLQWKKMEMFERKNFPRFTRAITVSTQDSSIVSGWMPKQKVDVVANGVDIDFFKTKNIPKRKHSLVFTGSLDWRPNVDGLLHFLDTSFLIIQKQVPDCHFVIVGRNPMQVLRDKVKGMKGVELTGTVQDVRQYIDEAEVYVVPLRVGGGSRLKILEAFSMEQAVVSTSVGAEGLDVVPDENIILVDNGEDFAFAVIELFRERGRAESMGKSGRTLVKEHYQWQVLAKRLEANWMQAISEHGNGQ